MWVCVGGGCVGVGVGMGGWVGVLEGEPTTTLSIIQRHKM